jgi:hypothetical protein
MPRLAHSLLLLAAVAALTPAVGRAAVVVSLDLGTPAVTATTATVPVSLTFTGAAGDNLQAVQLSVLGSSPLLTAGGTAFGRFAFALDPTAAPGWAELVGVGAGGVGLYAPLDPVAGPFLPPGSYALGTLTVDLTGLPGGAAVTVSLAGGPPGLGSDAGGEVGGVLVPSFAAADPTVALLSYGPGGGSAAFTVPAAAAVPEPTSLTAIGVFASGLLLYRQRRRQ